MNKHILTTETKELLQLYFKAAKNLYGMISLRKLLEIYNSHNEPIAEEQFLEFIDNTDFSKQHYDIIGTDEMYDDLQPLKPIDRDLLSEYLYACDDEIYYEVRECQIGIPYYVPSKEKLLKYADEYYFEKTMEFISVRAFLRNLGYLTKERADDIADEIQLMSSMNDSVEHMLRRITFMGVRTDDPYTFSELMKLCQEVDHSTRKHVYCGHTYNEIFK